MLKIFAIALYDNDAESEDELTFKKNDLIQVFEYDYMGMEGWWLCKLVKTNKMGLAAGNRLKVTNDEKLISRLSNIGKLSSNKIVFGHNKLNSVLSNSSSASSILSSSSSSISTASSSNTTNTQKQSLNTPTINNKPNDLPTRLQTMSLQTPLIQLPSKLPPKLAPKTLVIVPPPSNDVDDDDYDYDIPENNQPIDSTTLISPLSSNTTTTSTTTITPIISSIRKSISPTIDSGVSTSSLASLNSSDLPISSSSSSTSSSSSSTLNNRLSSDSNNSASSTLDRDAFAKSLAHILSLCTHLNEQELNQTSLLVKREKLIELRPLIYRFISTNVKHLKQHHVCFHPDLNVFNRFKSIYRQLKDFYFFYEASLTSLDKVYSWNYELIVQQTSSNEYFDLVNRISHLGDLMRQLRVLVNESCLFDYNSETTSSSMVTRETEEEPEEDYQYDYDNNANTNEPEIPEMSDYCTIDEDEEEENNEINSATLKKTTSQEEQIRREVRIQDDHVKIPEKNTTNTVTSTTNSKTTTLTATTTPIRLTMCDQMLIKFYLKHIEENLSELSQVQQNLIQKLEETGAQSKEATVLAHKLAISGHKLVFICDTLQRNINNLNLKQNLFESSNSLCSSLKVYMIRLKSNPTVATESFKKLILESISNVFECANEFKSIILKYYFKSF